MQIIEVKPGSTRRGSSRLNMDPTFWHGRWQANDIGFHQPAPHPALGRYWNMLDVKPRSRVFVPLAGKSIDMVWLAEHGHEVVGAELSQLAIDGFFADRSRAPGIATDGAHTIYRAGPFELWCGDYFSLPTAATQRISAVYDRAAFVAMPYSLQPQYAAKLAALTPRGVPVLLIALEYDPSQMEGPPFSIPQSRIETLFSKWFDINLLARHDGAPLSPGMKKRGVTWLSEPVYLLRRNGRTYG
jgi:thiopurine S-methyltransferase